MPLSATDVDFIAYGSRGEPLLIVEVKSQRQTSGTWAGRFRQNLMAMGSLPAAPFFLVATPERLYFWRQDETNQADRPPEFTVDAATELKSYFEKLGPGAEKLSRFALQSIIFTWLIDISQPSGQARVRRDPSLQWLSRSGLLDALSNAHIETAVS